MPLDRFVLYARLTLAAALAGTLAPTAAIRADAPHAPPSPISAPGNTSLILFGDLAPSTAASRTRLQSMIETANLLHPLAVLTTGNLIDGQRHDADAYRSALAATREQLAPLTMPWLPCAGEEETRTGTPDPADPAAAALYQQLVAPLYYSVNLNDIHAIVLDSEESADAAPHLSRHQLTWLEADLNNTFDNRDIHHVIVLLHRPLWRDPGSNWKAVARLLNDFNHRPLVVVEGLDRAAPLTPPHVDAVFAGRDNAYSEQRSADGIDCITLGPTGAPPDGTPLTGRATSMVLFHADATNVAITVITPDHLYPSDMVTAADRAVIDSIYNLTPDQLGIRGTLEQPLNHPVGSADENGPLTLVLKNPLDVPLDVAIRLAALQDLTTPSQRDAANPYADNFDSAWQLHVPYADRHLPPHSAIAYHMAISAAAQTDPIAPPQVEFVINWRDSRGRSVPIVLKRRVPVLPTFALPTATENWAHAVLSDLFLWDPADHPDPHPNPEWSAQLSNATAQFKINVEDSTPSFFAPPHHTPLGFSDAVILAWQQPGAAVTDQVTFYPFAPDASDYWIHNLPNHAGAITAHRTATPAGYSLMIEAPRAVLFPTATPIRANLTVIDNDGGVRNHTWSWAVPDAKNWGTLDPTPPLSPPSSPAAAVENHEPAHP
jgi:hypothetical protein